jgi:beta-aspartyl-peptidase (threonine type)
MTPVRPLVLVHGGAGPMKKLHGAEEARYRAGLLAASRAGLAALDKGGSALDAVVAAILSMEDSGEFNAGAGACLDEEGRATLDAALMRGADLGAGAVGATQATRNPILVARDLLEEGRHVLLVGEGADRRARALGLTPLAAIDDARKKIWARMLAERQKTGQEPADRLAATSRPSERLPSLGAREDENDTVGAAAVDAQGRCAAAVSTGGLWLKAPFRVGDSAIPGGGLYASDALGGAAVATGIGERIMKVALSKDACDRLGRGASAQEAAEGAIRSLTERFGADSAGLIVVDRKGRIGAAFDTRGMGRAFARGEEAVAGVWAGEAF